MAQMIVDPRTAKRLSRVYVVGKGWYRWNGLYRVYNSDENYEQMTPKDVANIDFNKSTEQAWMRHETSSVETRSRDVVVRIADWSRNEDEPAYDVEVYVAGEYAYDLSKTFTVCVYGKDAANEAAKFAAEQVVKLFARGG